MSPPTSTKNLDGKIVGNLSSVAKAMIRRTLAARGPTGKTQANEMGELPQHL